MDLDVLPYSQIEPGKHTAAIGIGNPVNRRNAQSELPGTLEYGTFIHPDARVSRWADIGTGGIITAGCIVTSQIRIGQQCHLNLNTTIGHDCQIGDYVTTAPAVNISGICTIGNNVYFGTGSSTRQGLMIVDDTVIGMGAMVVKDIDEPGTYIGIPAKKLES